MKAQVWPCGWCVYTQVHGVVCTQVCVHSAQPGNRSRERHRSAHTLTHVRTSPTTSSPECPEHLGWEDTSAPPWSLMPSWEGPGSASLSQHKCEHSLNTDHDYHDHFSTNLQINRYNGLLKVTHNKHMVETATKLTGRSSQSSAFVLQSALNTQTSTGPGAITHGHAHGCPSQRHSSTGHE